MGDAETQAAGRLRRAEGAVQDAYGSAKESAESMEDAVRDWIENRPYTAAVIALAAGWLIGRSHRPL